jgi:hypothetical protein
MPELFSTCQFFEDGSYEYVRRRVDAVEAARAAHFYTHNVAARCGITQRVIVTDALDCICFEWKYGEGVVFPTKEMIEELKEEDNDKTAP